MERKMWMSKYALADGIKEVTGQDAMAAGYFKGLDTFSSLKIGRVEL
jgi:hypothetical protein